MLDPRPEASFFPPPPSNQVRNMHLVTLQQWEVRKNMVQWCKTLPFMRVIDSLREQKERGSKGVAG